MHDYVMSVKRSNFEGSTFKDLKILGNDHLKCYSLFFDFKKCEVVIENW